MGDQPIHLLDFTNTIILCTAFLGLLYIVRSVLDDAD